MNLKEIQELVKIINKSNIAEISIEKKDFKITLKAKGDEDHGPSQTIAVPIPQAALPAAMPAPAPVAAAAPATPPPAKEADNGSSGDESKYITITSPMIGTFYRSSSPDKEPFVKVGDTINAGDVVCIIEAMKLFNEIEAEVSGKVVKVIAENSSPVEYDQPLFLIDPA